MKKLIPLFLIVLLVISSANAVVIGVGGTVFLKDVLRGGFATSRVYVSNANDVPISVGVWITGDTADWITLSPSQPYVIEPGQSTYVDVTVQPPAFTPNGVYTGEIIFIMDPSANGGGTGAALSAGASAQVIIEVSDREQSNLFVNSLIAERTEECRPINLKVNLKNTGNVELTPNYDVKLYHSQKGFVTDVTFKKEVLKPTIQRTDTLSIPYSTTGLSNVWEQFVCLPMGQYYAEVTMTDQLGNQYYKGRVDTFVLEKGTLSLSGVLESINNTPTASIGEPVKVTGKFNNTGVSTEQAKLKLEVYKGSKLVEVINGEETAADPGKVTDVAAYFIPKSIGEFELQGSVNFGGKFTNIASSSIVVELGITVIVLIVVVPLALLIVLVLIWLKKRRGY